MSYLSFCPTGVVFPFAGSAAPEGWLLCNGAAVSISTYQALYNVITTTYNNQTDPTTGNPYTAPSAGFFRVPDYRGLFLRGTGTASGADVTNLGGYQAQKTGKNGLSLVGVTTSVTGNKNQMDITSLAVSGNKNQFDKSSLSLSGAKTQLNKSGLSVGGMSAREAHDHGAANGVGGVGVIGTTSAQFAAGGASAAYCPTGNVWEMATANLAHVHGVDLSYVSGDTFSASGSDNHTGTFSASGNYTYSSTFSASGTTPAQTISADNETRPVNRGVLYIIKI